MRLLIAAAAHLTAFAWLLTLGDAASGRVVGELQAADVVSDSRWDIQDYRTHPPEPVGLRHAFLTLTDGGAAER